VRPLQNLSLRRWRIDHGGSTGRAKNRDTAAVGQSPISGRTGNG
jgi:hypothetical protein